MGSKIIIIIKTWRFSSWSFLYKVSFSCLGITTSPVFLWWAKMVQTLHSLTFVHIDTSLGERLVLRQMMIHWMSSDMGFPWGIDGGRTQTHGMVQHEVQMMVACISWTEKTDTEQFQCVSLCISVILNWYLLSAYHKVCLQPLYLQKSIQVFAQSKTHLLPILLRK